MKDLLDLAPKFLAVLSAMVLTLTVVHEYGYFGVVGSHLQTIATTYDYLANAFIWLPTAMGSILSVQFLSSAMEIEEIKTDDGQTKHQIKYRGFFYFIWAIAAISVVLYLLFGGLTASLAVLSFMGVTVVFFLTRGLKTEGERLQRWRLGAFFAYVALLAYGYGVSTGYLDLAKSNDVYALALKDSQGPARRLVLLRVFDKGLLVRDLRAQTVEFLRWDVISTMSKFAPKPDATQGYLCTWFDVACRRQEVGAPFEP
ncbi:hypothetical protein ACQR1H_03155 [Bradyrhizobium sp. HKCCYLRH2015]|uniref:hypothetical protein n=1 Tax=Bradyrhizobium sp. HKCCYLRH2015 TaxID=3420742 RepID=UPI003EBCC9E4